MKKLLLYTFLLTLTIWSYAQYPQVDKRLIFQEQFTSEYDCLKNGGTPSNIDFAYGSGTFNGTSSKVNYDLNLNGVYSVRVRCNPTSFAADRVILDLRGSALTGIGIIYITGGVSTSTSGTVYVNGIATTTTVAGVNNEIFIAGITLRQGTGLNKTLQAQGFATLAAGLFGSTPVTTYGESTASVAISKVSSKYVIGGAAVLAIIISFTPLLTLLAYIPTAVFGGLSLLLYCFIFLNGLNVLLNSKVDFGNQKNLLIVSSMILIGTAVTLIPSYSGIFIGIDVFKTGDISFQMSGLMLPLIIGVLMQALLPDEQKDLEIKHNQ